METDRSDFCGCKGIRSCLLCEQQYGIKEKCFDERKTTRIISYCCQCNKCHSRDIRSCALDEVHCIGEGIDIPGIYILPDFLSLEEESILIEGLDSIPWTLSQSGRRKQNFGPKCNFKKRKLKLGDFNGFPECSKFVQDKFKYVDLLQDYHTIEQCSLEYDPDKGACIEPHIDDCWVWGERIITVNLLSDSILSLRPYIGPSTKYNLDCVPHYSCSAEEGTLLKIPMPRRSLLIMFGEVRYAWEHMIYRSDITERRVCLAYREFTPSYLPCGDSYYLSSSILDKAANFFPT